MYCDESVCLSVVLYASIGLLPNFTKFAVHVVHGRGAVLVWRRHNTLRTSGFVDNAISSYDGRVTLSGFQLLFSNSIYET